jgi:hypothetical protein
MAATRAVGGEEREGPGQVPAPIVVSTRYLFRLLELSLLLLSLGLAPSCLGLCLVLVVGRLLRAGLRLITRTRGLGDKDGWVGGRTCTHTGKLL